MVEINGRVASGVIFQIHKELDLVHEAGLHIFSTERLPRYRDVGLGLYSVEEVIECARQKGIARVRLGRDKQKDRNESDEKNTIMLNKLKKNEDGLNIKVREEGWIDVHPNEPEINHIKSLEEIVRELKLTFRERLSIVTNNTRKIFAELSVS